MNLVLKKEIIHHIFKIVGIFFDQKILNIGMIDPIISEKFLIDKKIAFETEDKKKYENNIWAVSTKVENAIIKIIVADIAEDISEFTLILQMDNFLPCALRLSKNEDDYGSILFNVKDNEWIDASTLFQAKILVGMESLSEMYLQWEKLDNYTDMYKNLVGFLNYYERD